MKSILLLTLIGVVSFTPNLRAQNIVPPPPSRPTRPVVVAPPPPPTIRFANGTKVEVLQKFFLVISPDGFRVNIERPLPDLARDPRGCAWLKHWLDTHTAGYGVWKEHCQVYLFRCLNLR